MGFQSTLPARGATRYFIFFLLRDKFQSTLPARGATVFALHLPLKCGISIHAPREGSDPSCGKILQLLRSYFNPRSPRGERPAD